MPSFSHSRIGSYESCPLQYKYSYIDRIEVEVKDTVETFLGSRVHEALEKLYRDKKFERLLTLEELLAYFNKRWQEEWKDTIIIVKKDYTQENFRKMGERQLEDYYNKYKPFDHGKILGLETKDQMPLDEDGNYKFHIRIDRLMDMGNGLYEVHDYKTGSSLSKQEDLDNDRQLAMYSLWVRKQFKDFKKARLVWHFLAFDKEMDSFRTDEQLEELKEEVLTKIREIEEAKEFPSHVSQLCDWCLYKEICPEWKHEIQLEQKPENEYLKDPGLKLVDEYVRVKKDLDENKIEAEGKLEKLKQALIAFCEKEGVSAVFGSENKISVKEYEYIKFPAKNTEERKKLLDALKKIDRLDEVSELDIYALVRKIKDEEWDKKQLEILNRFKTIEKSHRFSVSKK